MPLNIVEEHALQKVQFFFSIHGAVIQVPVPKFKRGNAWFYKRKVQRKLNRYYNQNVVRKLVDMSSILAHLGSPAQFENRIKPQVYVRRVTRSTMYEQAPIC